MSSAPHGQGASRRVPFHLEAKYRDKNGGPAIGAQLQALRVAAANPASELWRSARRARRAADPRVRKNLTDCKRQPPAAPRSKNTYIPKPARSSSSSNPRPGRANHRVQRVQRFAGRVQRPAHRGRRRALRGRRPHQPEAPRPALQFKLGPADAPHQVMLAGVESMAEGHSYPMCNNVILMCYSWAYDKFEQAINRAHRINSVWNVNVYPIICTAPLTASWRP